MYININVLCVLQVGSGPGLLGGYSRVFGEVPGPALPGLQAALCKY